MIHPHVVSMPVPHAGAGRSPLPRLTRITARVVVGIATASDLLGQPCDPLDRSGSLPASAVRMTHTATPLQVAAPEEVADERVG